MIRVVLRLPSDVRPLAVEGPGDFRGYKVLSIRSGKISPSPLEGLLPTATKREARGKCQTTWLELRQGVRGRLLLFLSAKHLTYSS